jgi:site-specific DNA-methyltransferase (adenine-specific)
MKNIPDQSVDLILCDLPYGTSKCRWDSIIPFNPLWKEYERIIKPNSAVVLFGSEPFSSHLRLSNLKQYKYDWNWVKSKANGFLNAKKMPMKNHEQIMVFGYGTVPYYPQGTVEGEFKTSRKSKVDKGDDVYGEEKEFGISKVGNYPKSTIYFSNPSGKGHLHPTQKPVDLLEYLICTYTQEGAVVLDNCAGSGSTMIACLNTNRNYIGFELDVTYYRIAIQRIEEYIRS